MLYVGIDQHRKQLTVSVREETGNVILRMQVSTEWKKVRTFFDEVRQLALAHHTRIRGHPGILPPRT